MTVRRRSRWTVFMPWARVSSRRDAGAKAHSRQRSLRPAIGQPEVLVAAASAAPPLPRGRPHRPPHPITTSGQTGRTRGSLSTHHTKTGVWPAVVQGPPIFGCRHCCRRCRRCCCGECCRPCCRRHTAGRSRARRGRGRPARRERPRAIPGGPGCRPGGRQRGVLEDQRLFPGPAGFVYKYGFWLTSVEG